MPHYQTGTMPDNITQFNEGPDLLGSTGLFNTTPSFSTTSKGVYASCKEWAFILIFVSLVLTALNVGSPVLEYKTFSPDILDSVRSMTRDDPYFDLPSGGCTLNGLKRTRLLKNVEVKIQDVGPKGDVGHIAISASQGPVLAK